MTRVITFTHARFFFSRISCPVSFGVGLIFGLKPALWASFTCGTRPHDGFRSSGAVFIFHPDPAAQSLACLSA